MRIVLCAVAILASVGNVTAQSITNAPLPPETTNEGALNVLRMLCFSEKYQGSPEKCRQLIEQARR